MRILVVDDFEDFRRFVLSTLQQRSDFQIVAQAADGLDAVQQAQELQPDLILLDIGLPTLNGMEAARRIRTLSPQSKILFISQESSAEIVEEGLRLGAQGYLLKSDAAAELLTAVDAVLQGNTFLSRRLRSSGLSATPDVPLAESTAPEETTPPHPSQKEETSRIHKVVFFPNDAAFVDGFIEFIEAALENNNPVIVIATSSHRSDIFQRLQARGCDVAAARQAGTYISLDVRSSLSTFMVNDWPDTARFLKMASDLMEGAARAAKRKDARVAACGECAPMLWKQGNTRAAIQLEHLWDQFARAHDVDVLCGYMLSDFQRHADIHFFERICAEHSAACSV